MNYTKRYVVYETTVSSQNHHREVFVLGLIAVKFKGFQSNSFETEQEAIDACIEEGITYQYLLIIPRIFITT